MNSAIPVTGPTIMSDLLRNGGGTYAAGTLAPFKPEDGYAVGTGGVEMTLAEFEALGPSGRATLLRQIAEEYESNYVGTWHDEPEGIVYVDSVHYFGPLAGQGAWQMAVRHAQKEVYDFAAKRSIRPGQITFDQ